MGESRAMAAIRTFLPLELSPRLLVVSLLSFIVGTIHVLLIYKHIEILLYAYFFMILGVLQILFGALLITSISRRVWNSAIIVTLTSIILYATSRMAIVPSLIEPEAIEPLGLFTKVAEGGLLALIVAIRVNRGHSGMKVERKGYRTRTLLLGITSIVIVGLLVGVGAVVALTSSSLYASFYGVKPDLNWSYNAGPSAIISSPPTLSQGLLYVGVWRTSGNEYQILGMNATNGFPRWTYSTNGLCVCSAIGIQNGTLYVVLQFVSLYAMDSRTGTPKWSYASGGQPWNVEKMQTPQEWDGRAFALLEGDHLYAVNATNGHFLWEYGHGTNRFAPFAVADGAVYLGSQTENYFYALNATDGSLKWETTTDSPIMGPPTIINGTVYVASRGSLDGKLGAIYAFEASTGQIKWATRTGMMTEAQPMIYEGLIYLRGMASHDQAGDGKKTTLEFPIYAVDQKHGELVWKSSANLGLGIARVAIAHGVVYVGDVYGNVQMVDARNGWFVGTFPTNGGVPFYPITENDNLFFGSNDGIVYGLKVKQPNVNVVNPFN